MKYSKPHNLAFLVTGFPPDVSRVSHFNWERVRWFAQQDSYLVKPNDVETLADYLHKVLLRDNEELTKRALQIAKQFSLEQECQNLHHYYQKILN